MARIRTVKPDFWSDEKLAKVSRNARLLLIALLNQAQDNGVARGNPIYIRTQAFPYDHDVTVEMVAEWVNELARVGILHPYTHNGQALLFIINFSKHQKIDKPSAPTLPLPNLPLPEPSPSPPRALAESSTSPRRALAEPSPTEGKGRESKGNGVDAAPPKNPPPEFESTVPDINLHRLAKEQAEKERRETEIAWLKWAEEEKHRAHPRVLPNPPKPHEVKAHFDEVMAAGVKPGQHKAAFKAFLSVKWACDMSPPCPWPAWFKHWRNLVPGQTSGPPKPERRMLGGKPMTPQEVRKLDQEIAQPGSAGEPPADWENYGFWLSVMYERKKRAGGGK